MRLVAVLLAVSFSAVAAVSTLASPSADAEHAKVMDMTSFLESHPFDENAPVMRAWLIDWEDKSKDVVDVVCPPVLAPLPDDKIPNNPELLSQFIFGSAAYQLANPSEKGKLVPTQVAGMRSMLKAYRSMVLARPEARNPGLDELSKKDSEGSLEAYLTPLVLASCK